MASKVGAILGLIGGIIFVVAGLILFQLVGALGALAIAVPIEFYISFLLTIVWGVLVIAGAVLSLRGNKLGNYLMLVFGIVGLAGTFIPLFQATIPPVTIVIAMNGSFLYIDCILSILGGILGIALAGRD